MLALGFQEQKEKKQMRSGFGGRDDSPDSVIVTHESNFSLFSSASGSVERCSFASDVHDHESLVSELSKHLAGCELHECSCGPNLDPNDRLTVKHSHAAKDPEAKECKDLEEETEDDNLILEPAKRSFSRVHIECQARGFRSGGPTAAKKPGGRRPASLDLNNPKRNVPSASPRLGAMKKTSVSSHKSGTFPSPGTPNYWQSNAGVQKGWSSERVPLPANPSRRNMGVTQLPFNSGRTLPSKWEDAEKWIFSPVSGDGVSRQSVPQPQRLPKSKSGPLGPPGVAYYLMHSPSMPTFQGGSVGTFLGGSPFSAGVLAADRLPSRVDCSGGSSSAGASYPAMTEPCITRSASVHGWSSGHLRSFPGFEDENLDGNKDAVTMISHDVSRRDMATQMSPEGSIISAPRGRPSFTAISPSSLLPIVELKSHHPSKLDVRDVQVDGQPNLTRWSKKYGGHWAENGFVSVGEWKKKSAESQASSWEVSEATKCTSKFKREEAKNTAWENLQKAKAEAAIRKLEMKLEKKRSSSMDKIMKKLQSAQRKAQEMRSSVSASQAHHIVRTSNRTISIRRHTQMGSLSGCFTCHAF